MMRIAARVDDTVETILRRQPLNGLSRVELRVGTVDRKPLPSRFTSQPQAAKPGAVIDPMNAVITAGECPVQGSQRAA